MGETRTAQDMIDVQSFIWTITGDDGPAAG
jgi:hypothetical protein